MRKLHILLLLLVATVSAKAGDWTKEQRKAFAEAEACNLVIDMSKTFIMGLDSAEFVTYYADKEQKTTQAASLVIKRFKNLIAANLAKSMEKEFCYPKKCDENEYEVLLKMNSITDKAGLTGKIYVYKIGEKDDACIASFMLKEGRWNSFDKLLDEAAENIAPYIGEVIHAVSKKGKADSFVLHRDVRIKHQLVK